ncbi:MAG: YggT family protein [Anaerolineae bacterium]|nr:YggT family protein [Anaerolineae bacterium]
MGSGLAVIIRTLGQVLTLLIIADSLLSFFMSPYHPIREALGRILNPLYAPIRRFLPSAGGLDFSPIVLILLVQVIETVLISVVLTLG